VAIVYETTAEIASLLEISEVVDRQGDEWECSYPRGAFRIRFIGGRVELVNLRERVNYDHCIINVTLTREGLGVESE
jgi:hypothetical protein